MREYFSTKGAKNEMSDGTQYRPSVLAWLISLFSGLGGLIAKVVLLCILNGITGWAIIVLFTQDRALWALGTLAVLVLFDYIYLVPNRFLPAKFMLPGSVLLISFVIVPIFFTINTAFQKYSTGHVLTKIEAIETNLEQNVVQGERFFRMAPTRDASGELVLVLVDDTTGQAYLGRTTGLQDIDPASVGVDDFGYLTPPPGLTLIEGEELFAIDAELADFLVPLDDGGFIRTEGVSGAYDSVPGFEYDSARDTMIATDTGVEYIDNGRGSFASANGDELVVGWREYIGFENFTAVITNPLVRQPFLRAFIWTVVFAGSTVLLSFAVGLFLAKVLDKQRLRMKKAYRSMLVIPYAIPGFLSLLVFRGLLNEDYGVINQLLPFDPPWLFDPWWARASVILVSVWLTTPYFMLVCMGALQSIPGELVEAARVDGAGRWQVFRKVTLPLLLAVVTPLLVASFAYNFNNFNNVFLLTGGGPTTDDQGVAGATDILISYTYKLAFESGKGQDYGLASAISIYIFFIVAAMSASGFMRSKALENMK
jgi:arabinogalactan oligomer/maltooligosaccharide transport system permease protein